MADNTVNIPLKLKLEHKQALEVLKADIKKAIEAIKTEGKKHIEQVRANNKLEVQESKNKTTLKIAQMRNETAQQKIELAKQRDEQKKINAQIKKDNELLARVQQRQLQNAFQGTGDKKMSIFQKAEFAENITTITMGIGLAITAVNMFAQKMWEMARSGSELMTLRNHFEKISGSIEKATQDMELLRTATSGNLSDKEILAFANRMREVGLSTNETAQILDMAERIADKMGVTLEDAQIKLFKWIETGKGRGFEQMGLDINALNSKVEEYVRLTGKSKDAIDEEELSSTRLKTAVELYGDSIQKINGKLPELDDKIAGASKRVDNFKDSLGESIAIGIEPTISALGTLANAFNGTDMRPLDEAIKKISNGFIGLQTILSAVRSPLSTLIMLVSETLPKAFEKATRGIDVLYNALSQSPSGNLFGGIYSMLGSVLGKAREVMGVLNKIPGVNIQTGFGTSGTWDDMTTQDYKKGDFYTREGEYKSGWGDFYSDLANKTSMSSSRGGSKSTTEAKEILNLIQEQEKILKDLNEQLILNAGYSGAILEINEKIKEANEKIYFYKTGITEEERRRNVLVNNPISNTIENTGTYQTYQGGNSFIQSKDIQVIFEGMLKPLGDAFTGIFDTIGNSLQNISIFFGEAGQSFISDMIEGFNRILSIVQFISSIFETMKAVNSLIGIVSGIFTGGASLGLSTAGMMPIQRFNSSSNVYISANMDGLTFLKSEMPKYKNYQTFRKI